MNFGSRIISMGVKAVLASVTLLVSLGSVAQSVISDVYSDPGLYPNRNYVNQSLNEHIDPFTGSLQHHYTDIYLPGNGGFDIKVIRSYNSVSINSASPAAYKGIAGLGWSVHFGRVLKPFNQDAPYGKVCENARPDNVGDNPALELPDGSRQLLAFTGTSFPLATTQRWLVFCSADGETVTAYSPDGVRYDMAQKFALPNGVSAWYTTRITDRNGNYANISYVSTNSPEVSQIITNDGRLVSFTYLDSGLNARRIASISAHGQTYQYNYQAVSGVVDTYYLTSVVRPDGRSWSYAYNGNLFGSAGSYRMNKVTYPNGGQIGYEYGFVEFDSYYVAGGTQKIIGTVVSKKSAIPGGNWFFSYTPGGLGYYDTTTVTAPSGTTTYRHYGARTANAGSGMAWAVGLLISKALNGVQTETYVWGTQKLSDEDYFRPNDYLSGRIDSATYAPILTQKQITRNGASYTTNYSSFDGFGNPGSITEAGQNGGNRTTSLSYYVNTLKWIVKQVQNESFSGSSVTRSFDSNGNLTSITRDGVTTSYTYDNQGNIASTTFPKSLTHNYSNYKRGIAQSESQPEGIVISRVVSDAGNITSETNGEGRTTTYGYDGLNRVTSIGYPVGNSVSISYGASFKTATRGSLIESTSYDGFGRPVSITLGGISRSFGFDALGRKTFESNPSSSSGTSYQYDILDRVTKITNADGTFRSISYGAGLKTVTDERSKSTTYSYRAYGDPGKEFLMNISAPDSSANISLSRNSKDLITSATQGGVTRNYGYNSNYYLTSVTNPETGTTSYGRDAAGNTTSRSVGSSGATSYTYDGQNRLTSVTYPGSTPSTTQVYSKTHKLLTVNSSAASRSYSYDANNNLTGESVTADGITLTTGYAYNGLDQLSSITYPRSGKVVSYAPDALGRPTQVSGYVSSVSYWPSGQVKQINYANGTITNYNQNSRLWPSSFSTQKNGAYYVNSNYSYDGAGNLTSIGDTADSSYNRTLAYDNIDRLTSVSGPWGSGTIAYNGVGNITSQVLGGSSLYYSYDGTNRLSSISGSLATSYTYDAYGNIAGGSGNSYTYDDVPNLRCVNCGNAANKIEYSYDGGNQRVSATKAGVKTYEVYGSHGDQLIEYTPSQSNRLVEYIYLGGKRIAQRVTP